MTFDYDQAKSGSNLAKHGIDFEAAQALWGDPLLVVARARTDDEVRFLAIGKIGRKYWSAIWTPRGPSVRLISVRRSRKEEIERYESQ